MKQLLFITICFWGYSCMAESLNTIHAQLFNCEEEEFSGYCAETIEEYKRYTELWGSWSFPIGNISVSSELANDQNITYKAENIYDYDLNSAWIPKDSLYGIGEYFEFEFAFPENTDYAGAYQFMGICYLFNGYCKSYNTWRANCRIKKLKVLYNSIPLCYVALKDTWKYQQFDLSCYFINLRDGINLNAKYEIRQGDKLRFQIVEIYKGTEYKDVAISEFLCRGGEN